MPPLLQKLWTWFRPGRWLQNIINAIRFERSWLADLVHVKRIGRTIWATLSRLMRLPGRLYHFIKELAFQLKPRTPAMTISFGLVVVPVVAIALLVVATFRVIPQKTTFEQSDIFTSAPQQRILIVHHSGDTFGELAYANAKQSLDYAHLAYDSLDLAGPQPWPDVSQYSSVLFATELLNAIDQPQAKRLEEFVTNGGGLAVIYRGWNPHLAALFGFEAESPWPALLPQSEGGLEFQSDFFPGIKGLALPPEVASGHVPYNIQPRPAAQIIATSITGRPLAWLHRHQQGRVLFWNTAMLAARDARGLITQSVLNVQRVSVLPIANVGVIQIDDFPAPFPNAHLEPIATEYNGLSTIDFYSQVWYPDIINIARRFGLKYTFLIPFSYNNQTAPPFDFQEWQQPKIQLDGQDVPYPMMAAHMAAQEGELGLHGYNHLSLTLQNWGSQENMAQALQAAALRWDLDNLGDSPATYVPPHNHYDEAGARALTQAVPSLSVISGLYNSGQFEEGGLREFGPEPWNSKLFNLPRATSGYNLTPPQRLAMLSELGTMGVWTHFIHPDDVFDTPQNNPAAANQRNPAGWFWRGDHTGQQNGFYYRFLRWLTFIQTYYPWLRFVTTAEASQFMQAYLENEVEVALKPYSISIHSKSPTFFQVRINDGRRVNLNALKGAQLVHVYRGEGYTLYTLRGVKEEVNLQLLIPEVGK